MVYEFVCPPGDLVKMAAVGQTWMTFRLPL